MNAVFLIGQVTGVASVCCILLFAVARLLSRRRGGGDGVQDGDGRAVLITGCDSGFGHQLARRLDRQGFVVFAGCLCPEGPGARSLVRESCGNVTVLKLDVTSDAEVQQAKRVVQENLPEKGEGPKCGDGHLWEKSPQKMRQRRTNLIDKYCLRYLIPSPIV